MVSEPNVLCNYKLNLCWYTSNIVLKFNQTQLSLILEGVNLIENSVKFVDSTMVLKLNESPRTWSGAIQSHPPIHIYDQVLYICKFISNF